MTKVTRSLIPTTERIWSRTREALRSCSNIKTAFPSLIISSYDEDDPLWHRDGNLLDADLLPVVLGLPVVFAERCAQRVNGTCIR